MIGAARHLLPALGDRPLHGHAAAEGERQVGEVELLKLGIVHQRVEQRVEAGEDVDLVLAEFLDEGRNVARVGDQDVLSAGATGPSANSPSSAKM